MCDNFDALLRAFKRLRTLYAIYILPAVAALVLFFVDRWATLAALGVCMIYNIFVLRPASKAYSRSFVHVCAQSSLERHLSQAVHSSESVLDIDKIRKASLIPANAGKGGIVCHEGGSGIYHGRPVRMGDVTFTHSYTTAAGKTRHQFTNGLYLVADLGKDSGLDLRILFSNAAEDGSVCKMLHDKAGLESLSATSDASADWRFICANGKRTLPQDKLLQALSRLDKATNGWAAVCIQGDLLHVYIIDRLLGQRVSSRYAPDANVERADLIPELNEALNLVECI